MSNERAQKAFRFARFIYWIVGTSVVGLFVLWLAYGFLQETVFEHVADVLGMIWLVLFGSLPVLALIWIVRFASLATTVRELRFARTLMFVLIVAWAILVAGFIAFMVFLIRGLLNFL